MEHVQVNGARIPALGFGTWQLRGAEAQEAVEDALALGYRHIDTAQMYGNEAEVGAAIKASSVAPGEVFVVTKIADDNHEPDRVRSSTEESLRKLGVDAIDLLLVHRPSSWELMGDTLEAMQALRQEGLIRHVGVSNFSAEQFDDAQRSGPIVANQVEHHPYFQHPDLVGHVAERGATLTAYSPLGHGELLDDPVLAEIGERHGKTPAQVSLRWLLDQPRVTTIPKAADHDHRVANMEIFDFSLDEQDHRRIADLDRGQSAMG